MRVPMSIILLGVVTVAGALLGCKRDDGNPVIPAYIFATPSSVTMIGERDTSVALSGGIQPYVLLQSPKANIASIVLDGTTVLIHSAPSSGSDRIRIGDSAPSQNSVTIPIVVVQPSRSVQQYPR